MPTKARDCEGCVPYPRLGYTLPTPSHRRQGGKRMCAGGSVSATVANSTFRLIIRSKRRSRQNTISVVGG
jgi:hypothetical protein